MSITLETFSQDFKRAGKFDEHRKRLLTEFTESTHGQKLIEKLKLVASSSTSTQAQLIATLSQPEHYIEAERDINVQFLGQSTFKEQIKEELKLLWQQKYAEQHNKRLKTE